MTPLLRTILRRGFYSAAAASTLLLLATLILWPVSYYRWSTIDCVLRPGTAYGLGFFGGRALATYKTVWAVSPWPHFDGGLVRDADATWTYRAAWDSPSSGSRLGVEWLLCDFSPAPQFLITYFIPCSYLALLFSILPLLAFRSIRRRRRIARLDLCPKCGYDLRAHAPGSLCPECGTPVAGRIQHK